MSLAEIFEEILLTRTWNGISPLRLLVPVGETLDQVGREFAGSEPLIRNAIGKVHRTVDERFRDSGRKGIAMSQVR